MRQLAIAVLAALLSVICGCSGVTGAAGPVDLAQLSGWDIVVSAEAPPSEAYAAEEFQLFMEQACGVKLPVVKQGEGAGATAATNPSAGDAQATSPDHHFFIGESPAMKASGVGFEVKGMGPEDLRIAADGRNVAIAGGRPRGSLYGVYTFLEDYVGVRFLTAEHTHVPRIAGPLKVGPLDRTYHPPLAYRACYYGESETNPTLAVRLRLNGTDRPIEARLGGRSEIALINHSFCSLIPSQTYGREHPEYYAEIGGQRRWDVKSDGIGTGTQPCLSNPDVLRIVTAAVLDDLDKHPEKKCVSVSQNDNRYDCRCAKCKALDDAEGTPMGTLLTFVNAVADEVAKKRPDVTVGTLSYKYSRRPPKTIRPRPNVRIQLCSIECCEIHPIDDPACPDNVPFCRDMSDWGKVCDNICIWNYNTNFSAYLLPCPNLRVIQPNVRYFVANHARGVFMQAAGNAMGAEMSDLRNYVIAGLLWDPGRDGARLADEFLDLHYGKAAGPIRGFLALTRDRVLASGKHLGHAGSLATSGMDESVAQAGLDAFAEAMKLADDDTVRLRVEKASVCAYRAALEPIWYFMEPSQLKPEMAARMRPLAHQFFLLCAKHKVTMSSEKVSIEDSLKRNRTLFGVKDGEEL